METFGIAITATGFGLIIITYIISKYVTRQQPLDMDVNLLINDNQLPLTLQRHNEIEINTINT